jgi:hypothetical protein
MRYALLSDLVTRTRARVGYENNQHITDAELKAELKSAARALLDVLLEIHGPEPYRKTVSLNLTDGISVYDLPTSVKEVLAVYSCAADLTGDVSPTVVPRGKPYAELRPFEEWERVQLLNLTFTDHAGLRWRLGGAEASDSTTDDDVDQIELLPVPRTPPYGTVYLSVVPHPVQATLTDDSDVRLLAPNNADEWLIARGCAYIRTKEKDDPSPFYALMSEVEGRIRAAHARRTTNEPQRMRGRSDRRRLRPGDYTDGEP